MERKEVGAILQDDLTEFLKKNDLYNSFIDGKILCEYCSRSIDENNIFSIYFDEQIKFCCKNEKCIELMNKRSNQ